MNWMSWNLKYCTNTLKLHRSTLKFGQIFPNHSMSERSNSAMKYEVKVLVCVSFQQNLYLWMWMFWVPKINSYQSGNTILLTLLLDISNSLQVESYLQLPLLKSLFQYLTFLLESRLGPSEWHNNLISYSIEMPWSNNDLLQQTACK